MKYKKKKYFKQNLDLKTIYLSTNFIFFFQLKPINITNWVSLKKLAFKHNLKLKIYSVKFLKKNNFFVLKSKLITKLYSSKILLIYRQNYISNIDYTQLLSNFLYFENLNFLICIYVLFEKKIFLANDFKKLIKLCLKNAKLILINILLIKALSFLKLLECKLN